MRAAGRRNPDYLDTSIFRFVSEEPEEFRPALIVDVFGQEAPTESSDLEILDCDYAELQNEPSAQVVCVISAKASDPFVPPSKQDDSFSPAP